MDPNFDDLLKVLNREQPKKVPLYEHIVDDFIMKAILQRNPSPLRSETKPLRKQKVYIRYLLDFFGGLGYDYIPLELGMILPRNNIIIGSYDEPLGKKKRFWVDENRSTIATQEECDEYPWPEPENAVDFKLLKAAAKILPKRMKLVSGVAGGVFEHVLWLVGFIPFSKAMRQQPIFVKNMFNKVGRLIEEVDKIIAEEEIVGSMRMGDDLGYNRGPMLNPKDLRKCVFPWHKRIAEVSHKKGKPFIFHSCGNLEKVIDLLIDYVKIDAWHSFQDNILPVTDAKERFGHRVAILGGVDVDILSREDKGVVRNYSRNILKKCKKNGGYAFGSGNSIPNYIKVENYLEMIDVCKKYGKY